MAGLRRRPRGEDPDEWHDVSPYGRGRAELEVSPHSRRGTELAVRQAPQTYRRSGRFSNITRPTVLKATAIVAACSVTAAALLLYGLYRNVYDSINHETVTNAMLGSNRPAKLNGSLNILVIGSDSRAGTHGRYGRGVVGSRSDTSMLLHISPGGGQAFVVSFPRDSMVPIVSCLGDGQGHPGQSAQPGQLERLNSTFSDGGAPCLWRTLEQTTHIHIDHFVEVNFSGFKQIVNDVGGINVCLPYAIHDPASGLRLSAGRHTVNGTQALAFVRERHIGLGSDLQRIQRQQFFLASAAQKIKSSGMLSNPTKVYSLVHDVASSLTTDITSLGTMLQIANTLKSMSTKSMRFISVPVVPYPGDPSAEVQWAPQANGLFRALAKDNKILKAARNANHSTRVATASKNAHRLPSVSPSQITLQVLNGGKVPGLAATTGAGLTSQGFHVSLTSNANNDAYTTSVIQYGSAKQMGAVNTLKAQVPGAITQLVPGASTQTLTLILGASFNGLLPAKAGPPKAPKTVATVSKNYAGISANANVCKDSTAFQGPDTPAMFGP